MLTLSYGFKKPQVPDQGGIVFPALEANWQQVNDHNHDGINSALIAGLSLPTQPGNSGKFLSTNGVSASWQSVEVITASNVGGAVGLFKQKTLADLEFKTIEAGTNITLNTTDPSKVVISASGGGGGVITVAGMRVVLSRNLAGNTNLPAISAPYYNAAFDIVDSDPSSIYNNSTFEFTIPPSYVGQATGDINYGYILNTGQITLSLIQKDSGVGFVDYRWGQAKPFNAANQSINNKIAFEGVAGDKFRIVVFYNFGVPAMIGTPDFNWCVFTIDPK